MPINIYLEANLFGLDCPVLDTSYVVYNLYKQKWKNAKRGVGMSPNSTSEGMPTQHSQIGQEQPPTIECAQRLTSVTEDPLSPRPPPLSRSPLAAAPPRPEVEQPSPRPSSPLHPPQVPIHSKQDAATAPQPPTTAVGALLSFMKAVNDMSQLPLSDVSQRASRRRLLTSLYVSSLPPAAKKLVDAVVAIDDTVRKDVFEVPLAASQAGRSARIGIQSSVRATLSKLRSLKTEIETLLNELNELADEEEPEYAAGTAGGERELICGPPGNAEVADRHRDELYDVCDQLYTDLVVPRIEVAETLLLSRTALALRTDDLCSFAAKAILLCYRMTGKTELGKLPSFGPLLWNRFAASQGSSSSDDGEGIPLSWLTNDVLDECEEAMLNAHADGQDQQEPSDDDAVKRLKDARDTERKALICLRMVIQEVPEQSRFLMDAVGALCQVFVVLESTSDDSLEGGDSDGMGIRLDALCDQLLSLGLMDAEMWLQDQVRATLMQRNHAKKAASAVGVPSMGSSRKGSFGASLKQSIVKRTMSFGSSMHGSPNPLHRSLSGALTPKQRMSVPSVSGGGVGDDGMNYCDSDGEDDDDNYVLSRSGGDESTLLNTLTASGNGGIGNSIEMLMQRLDGILGVPPPQSTSECLAVTSRLYDTLGRINMFLRRNGMAQETKVTATGKVVPTASDNNKVYLEHVPDEAQGFSQTESVLYEQGCLCFESWSQQNSIRQQLDELAVAADDEFFRACHEDLLAGLLAKADEFCVITESRTAVVRRLDRLLVVRVKIYHHSGEVRVITVPQRATLLELRQQLLQYLADVDRCDVFFLDDGDRVRISSNAEYEDLLRMRRGVVLEGMSLGASQLGKSLLSSNELKLELYLDPSLTTINRPSTDKPARVEVGAGGRGLPPVAKSTASPARQGAYRSLPPDYGNGGLSLNELIRRQEQDDAASGLEYQTGSVDLSKFFERKMAEKGIQPPTPPVSSTSQQKSAPAQLVGADKPKPVVVPPIPRNDTHAVGGGGPGEVLIYINPKQEQEHEARKVAKTRDLFLAMGKAKKPSHDQELGSSLRSPRETVSVTPSTHSPTRPVSHSGGLGYQPGTSVAVAPRPSAQWKPKTHNESLQLAQHPMKSSGVVSDAKDMLRRYLDDDEDDQSGAQWERGTDNHVQAVLYGGAGVSATPVRHNGPTRRGGVPLPPEARPTKKR